MTLMINIGTAFAVFIVSLVILSTNYKTIWPAPNFVTHSATYDYIFQDIATNSFRDNAISIEYAYKSQPIPTLSSKLINNTHGSPHHSELLSHASVLEKQSNLHHLLHIPFWALVPDRISHTSGTTADLFKIFDSLRNKQETTLSILSDLIEVIPTDSIIKSHMEQLSAAEKFWISNMTEELFNASQTIFSYQLINYAEEISEWIQNSPNSNDYLRLIFERIRGLPLLYNPSIPSQMKNIHTLYNQLCTDIIDAMEEDSDGETTIEQCELFLDCIIPWMPDKTLTLSTMWPTNYDINVENLKKIKGINSPYTMVVRQNKKPSGEMLHYVSSDGSERIQVEWFNSKYHLRATNLAFVRRIRIQIKRLSNILKNSVTLSSEMDEIEDFASLWASLEEGIEDGPKPSDRHIEQLSNGFKDYVKGYAAEIEKGQFDQILNMDLAMGDMSDNNIFIHGLPSMPIFNDGQIKRAWNFIIGIIDHELVSVSDKIESFEFDAILGEIQSGFHRKTHGIELEIMGVWPYAIAGYLRAITPEVSVYVYPPFSEAKKQYGKQRCVLLLDVIEKLYSNNMRQIGIQRLGDSDSAKLITLKSTVMYMASAIGIEHRWFHNRNEQRRVHSLVQGLFIRLAALVQCGTDDFGCVLSGVFYNIIEGFNRDCEYSLALIAFLESEGLMKWESNGKKDVINVLNNGRDVSRLGSEQLWNQWRDKYFNSENGNGEIERVKESFMSDKKVMKLYERTIRHVAKYSVLRRPGEDTFVLS